MISPYIHISIFVLLLEFVNKPPLPTIDVNPDNSVKYHFLIYLDLLKISDDCIVITSKGMELILLLDDITGSILEGITRSVLEDIRKKII